MWVCGFDIVTAVSLIGATVAASHPTAHNYGQNSEDDAAGD